LQFSACRSSEQAFKIRLQEGIHDQQNAFGFILIHSHDDENEEIARLKVEVEAQPKAEQTSEAGDKEATAYKKSSGKKQKKKPSKKPSNVSSQRRSSTASETPSSLWEWFYKKGISPSLA